MFIYNLTLFAGATFKYCVELVTNTTPTAHSQAFLSGLTGNTTKFVGTNGQRELDGGYCRDDDLN